MNPTFTPPFSRLQKHLYILLLFILLVACLLLTGGILAQLFDAEVFDDSVVQAADLRFFFNALSAYEVVGLLLLVAFVCAVVHCLHSFSSRLIPYQHKLVAEAKTVEKTYPTKIYKTVLVTCIACFLYLIPQYASAQTNTPTEVAACNGQPVTISIPVDQATFIQWWYRENADEPWVMIDGATDYTYTFLASTEKSNRIYEGDYYSSVSGWATTSYKLRVNAVPAIPATIGASRQGPGTITLTAAGAPTGGSYKWYTEAANGTPISGATGSAFTTPVINTTTTYYVAAVNSAGCESARKAVTATIINTAPSIPADINSAANTVTEQAANGALTGITASSSDPESAAVLYALTDDAGGRFGINSSTGVVIVANGSLLNFNTATAHTIKIKSTDGVLFSPEQAFTITVTNVNEIPVAKTIVHPVTLLNTATATPLTALDATDEGAVLSFRITSGPATGILSINGNQATLNTDYAWALAKTLSFDPVASNLLDIQLTYIVTDNEGGQSSPATLTIPINGEPVAVNVTNSKTLSTSAAAVSINALAGSDAETNGLITHFQMKLLPMATKGTLYIDGVEAKLYTDYEWELRSKLTFDPLYGNTSPVGFTYTVKDTEGAYAATAASYRVNIMLDYDVDGIADANDLDDDNDGIPDTLESIADADKDGIQNSFDLDADGDGLTDVTEYMKNTGVLALYNKRTGRLAGNVGANGLLNIMETSVDSGILLPGYSPTDADADGLADYLDSDADNDGLPDNLEAQPSNNRVMASGMDADRDGIDNRFDLTCGCPENGVTILIADTDGDNTPDYLDLDSDSDFYSDTSEAFDLNGDGKAVDDLEEMVATQSRISPNAVASTYDLADANNNEVPDMFEDDNADARLNFLEPGHTYYQDTDSNGLADLFNEDTFGPETSPNIAYRVVDTKAQLPVLLASFTAAAKGRGVSVNWETAMESENAHFVVERSLDGKLFRKLTQVKGAGNSSRRLAYNYFDATAPAGNIYYRLKQVDYNGKYTYSPTVSVELQQMAGAGILLYPSPATAYIKLNFTALPAAAYQIRLINMEGRVLHSIRAYNNMDQVIDTKRLAAGKYVIQIQNEATSKTVSLIKQ